MGWHAPRMRRVLAATLVGVIALVATWPAFGWELAVLTGWDVTALLLLGVSWHLILGADSAQTEHLARVEDESRRTAGILVLGASMASLLAVAFTLGAAGRQEGGERTASIVAALLTLLLSWATVNTLFTLRYADQHYRVAAGIDFGSRDADDRPDYRDFAYLAFTIGMCYQVSDTAVRDRRMRRTVLLHAVVSYLFGVVIIAAGINLVAGLIG